MDELDKGIRGLVWLLYGFLTPFVIMAWLAVIYLASEVWRAISG